MSSIDILRISIMNMATQMTHAQIVAMGVVAPVPFDPKNPQVQTLVNNMFVTWKIWYDGLEKSFDDHKAADNLADPTPGPESGGPLGGPANLQGLISALPTLIGVPANLPLLQQLASTLQGLLTPPNNNPPPSLNPTNK